MIGNCESNSAAALTERLIEAAVGYERAEGIYSRPARIELSEARAAVEAAIGLRAATIEECAKVAEPKGPRPCDCERCYCHNMGDAETVARWDAEMATANAIRALKHIQNDQVTISLDHYHGLIQDHQRLTELETPSDGSCIRCGSAPRNASGLCATCVDEDAIRAGEIDPEECGNHSAGSPP